MNLKGLAARARWQGAGFTLTEILVVIAVIGVLAGVLLPVLNKSRKSTNRTRDVGNMKELTRAFASFSQNNENRYPWTMSARKGAGLLQFFSPGGGGANKYDWDSMLDLTRLYQLQDVVDLLKSCDKLVSPTDPASFKENEDESSAARRHWGWEGPMNVNTPEGKANHGFMYKEVSEKAQSYAVCFGSDFGKGEKGIMLLTRNIAGPGDKGYAYTYPGGPLAYGGRDAVRASMVDLRQPASQQWLDPAKAAKPRDVMAGLSADEGQIAFCDGSAKRANNLHLKEAVAEHNKTQAGVLKIPNFNVARPRH